MSSNWGTTSPYGRVPPTQRPEQRPRAAPVNAWGLALVTFLLGTAVVLVLGFLIGTVGLLFVTGATLSGADLGDMTLVATAVMVAVVPLVVSIAVQALFIRKRGGSNHVLAPVAATGAGWLLSAPLTPLELTTPVLMVLNAMTQIAVLTYLVGRTVRGPVPR